MTEKETKDVEQKDVNVEKVDSITSSIDDVIEKDYQKDLASLDYTRDTRWVSYVLPMVTVEFADPNDKRFAVFDGKFWSVAWLDGEHPMVTISKAIWDKISNNARVDTLQHELSHLAMGHLAHVQKLKDKNDCMLMNICQDCAIHYSVYDPTQSDLEADWLSMTYEGLDVPPIPPKILFYLLKKRQDELTDKIKQAIKDGKFVCQTGSSGLSNADDIDAIIAQNTIVAGLQEALGKGEKLPENLKDVAQPNAGRGEGKRIHDFTYKEVGKWVHKMIEKLQTMISRERNLSYRRDPRMTILEGVLQKGRSRSWEKRKIKYRIDVSGSMSDELVDMGLSAGKDFVVKHKLEGDLALFDTKMSKPLPINDFKSIEKLSKNYGGGGTLFQPVIDEADPDDIIVFFTDTWCFENTLKTTHLRQKPIVVTTTDKSNIGHAVKNWDIIYVKEGE